MSFIDCKESDLVSERGGDSDPSSLKQIRWK
jgi:hypothetical protein